MNILSSIKNALIVCLIIVLPLIFGYYGKTIEMGITILSVTIAAFFLNIDKFKSLKVKGGGFKLVTKEKTDDPEKINKMIEEITKLQEEVKKPKDAVWG